MRFSEFAIGAGPTQLPVGVQMVRAELNLSQDVVTLHRVLSAWSENTLTWATATLGSNATGGLQADGIELSTAGLLVAKQPRAGLPQWELVVQPEAQVFAAGGAYLRFTYRLDGSDEAGDTSAGVAPICWAVPLQDPETSPAPTVRSLVSSAGGDGGIWEANVSWASNSTSLDFFPHSFTERIFAPSDVALRQLGGGVALAANKFPRDFVEPSSNAAREFTHFVDVTQDVQTWVDRGGNYGWALLSAEQVRVDYHRPDGPLTGGFESMVRGTNGFTPPQLTVVYSPVCVPGFTSATGAPPCTPCAAGSRARPDGGVGCEPCPAGFYAPDAGSAQCVANPAGTYSTVTGATQPSTQLCPASTFSAAGAATCTACTPPTTTLDAGASVCVSCPAGTTFDATNNRCTACPPGTFGSGGVCMSCSAGSFQADAGAGSCLLCAPGTFAAGVGASACVSCPGAPEGTFQPNAGATNCTLCRSALPPTGGGSFYVVFGNGATSSSQCQQVAYSGSNTCTAGTAGLNGNCVTCPAGTFAPAKQGTCTSCPSGTVSNVGSQSLNDCHACAAGEIAVSGVCQACPAGSITLDGVTCLLCPEGTIESNERCVVCAPGTTADAGPLCPRGTVPAASGTVCLPCSPGSVTLAVGATECTSCPEGTRANAASSTCEMCPAGTYARAGSVACSVCPADTASNAGSGSCDACPPPQVSPNDCQRQTCDLGLFISVNDDNEMPAQTGAGCLRTVCAGGQAQLQDDACDDFDICTADACLVDGGCAHTTVAKCSQSDGGVDAGAGGGGGSGGAGGSAGGDMVAQGGGTGGGQGDTPLPPAGCNCDSGSGFFAFGALLLRRKRRSARAE